MRNWYKCCKKEKKKYGSQMCNMGHLTVIFEFELAIMKVNMHAKNIDAASRHSSFIISTYTIWNRLKINSRLYHLQSLEHCKNYIVWLRYPCTMCRYSFGILFYVCLGYHSKQLYCFCFHHQHLYKSMSQDIQ